LSVKEASEAPYQLVLNILCMTLFVMPPIAVIQALLLKKLRVYIIK